MNLEKAYRAKEILTSIEGYKDIIVQHKSALERGQISAEVKAREFLGESLTITHLKHPDFLRNAINQEIEAWEERIRILQEEVDNL